MIYLDELKEIEQTLNFAQMEIRAIYKRQNITGSNVLDIIDKVWINIHNTINMKKWTTTIKALDPMTNILKSWGGPHICAPSWKIAQEYCNINGLGYCKVDGELIAEVPCKPNTYDPDFDNMTDYENQQIN